jgi:hypothetical protein
MEERDGWERRSRMGTKENEDIRQRPAIKAAGKESTYMMAKMSQVVTLAPFGPAVSSHDAP